MAPMISSRAKDSHGGQNNCLGLFQINFELWSSAQYIGAPLYILMADRINQVILIRVYNIKMDTQIAEWIFDLSQPVYLLHPNFKFWEVKLNGKNVTFRVGKLRHGTEENIEEVNKAYANAGVAKSTAINKIEEKLTKGYTPKDPRKADPIHEEKKEDKLKNKNKK